MRRLDPLSALVGAGLVVAAVLTVAVASAYPSTLQLLEPGDSPLPTDRCPAYKPRCHIDAYPSPSRWHLHHYHVPQAGRLTHVGEGCDRARRLYRARHHAR